MQRWLLCHRRPWWRRTDLYVKYATRGFRGIRIFSSIDGGTICHGSWGRGQARRWGRGCMFVLNRRVFITILLELWVISRGLRSISAENMARRSGNVTSALRNMRFNRIGKLTPRFAVPESINAIVELCFQGFHPPLCYLNSFLSNNDFWDLGFMEILILKEG